MGKIVGSILIPHPKGREITVVHARANSATHGEGDHEVGAGVFRCIRSHERLEQIFQPPRPAGHLPHLGGEPIFLIPPTWGGEPF